MRSQLPEHALVVLLRQCFVTPICQLPTRYPRAALRSSRSLHTAPAYQQHPRCSAIEGQKRGLHTRNGLTNDLRVCSTSAHNQRAKQHKSISTTTPNESDPSFAVLGGGITGLAAAHYLTREFPSAKITIYEGSERLGGWLNSKKIEVEQGEVVFEQGPRNLRPSTPAALVTLDMIKNLELEDKVLITPHHSVAAQNRFVYYPDHLVKMPGPGQDFFNIAWNLISEPVFKGLIRGSLFEFNQPGRPSDREDESIGSFLNRRLGSADPGNNIVSAVLHGIYAGDIYKLSVKSLIPLMWEREGKYGSITQALLKQGRSGKVSISAKDKLLHDQLGGKALVAGDTISLAARMAGASVYTFQGGLGTFSDAIATSLRANPNVQIKIGQKISSIDHDDAAKSITIRTTTNHPEPRSTHIISTLPAHTLASLTSSALPALALIPAVTVMVVNLYFPSPHLLSEPGFGYLIPRSIPFEQNPECALGVVFDSYSSIGQDTAPGTKLTVMLGGHWWDGFSEGEYPSEEEGAAMAKAVLKRHLNIDEEPERVLVGLQRDCIPQYTVGHEARLKSTHRDLKDAFAGKLSVAGNWVDGVGLNDCLRGARDVVLALKESIENNDDEGITGLEDFQTGRVWVETENEAFRRYREEKEKMEREKKVQMVIGTGL